MLQRRFNLKTKTKMTEDKQNTKHDLHLNKLKTHVGSRQTDPSMKRESEQEVPMLHEELTGNQRKVTQPRTHTVPI